MPYSGINDESLPENVKSLPAEQRRQWVSIFNKAMSDCKGEGSDDCEAHAFRVANGVMKREHGMTNNNFLFVQLAADLKNGKAFDALAPGKFTDMHGRSIEIRAEDLDAYLANTRAAIADTKTESGEVVGLPIDAYNHEKGDGAGWITDVVLSEGKLRVIPKWTEIGMDLIEKGIRRFFSATVDIGRKVIMGGTLTNWPASRDHKTGNILLRPIELGSSIYQFAGDQNYDDHTQKIRAAFAANFSEPDSTEGPWSQEVFENYLIAQNEGNHYRVGYKETDGEIMFDQQEDWKMVKRNWIEAARQFFGALLGSAVGLASLDGGEDLDNGAKGDIVAQIPNEDLMNNQEVLTMAEIITQESLDATIQASVDRAMDKLAARILDAAPVQPAPTTGDQPSGEMAAANDLIRLLNLDQMEEGAVQRLEAALADHFVSVQKSAETRYIQQLATITRKRDVAEFASRVTGGTPETPRGLPVKADELAKRVLALPAEDAKFWMDLCNSIVSGQIVEFTELGNNKPTTGTKQLPPEVEKMLRVGELTVADLTNPILGLGDPSEYNLGEFQK